MQHLKFTAILIVGYVVGLTPLKAQWTVGSSIDYRSNITESPVSNMFVVPKVGYHFKAVEVFANTSLPYFSETQDRPNWTAGLGANLTLVTAQIVNPFATDSGTFPLEVFGSVQYNVGHAYADRDDYLTAKYDESGLFTYWERQSYQFNRRGNFTQAGLGVRAKMGKFAPSLLLGIGRSPNLRVIYRIDELQSSGSEINTFEADYIETPVNLQIVLGFDVELMR